MEWSADRPCVRCKRAPAIGLFMADERGSFGALQTVVLQLCGGCSLTLTQSRKAILVERKSKHEHFVMTARYISCVTLMMFEVKDRPVAQPQHLDESSAVAKIETTYKRNKNTRYYYSDPERAEGQEAPNISGQEATDHPSSDTTS